MIDDTIEREPKHVTSERPAKRWRNWWVANVDALFECGDCGHREAFKVGDFVPTHCVTHPSYDVAITKSGASEAAQSGCMTHYDALPDGESP